jgi:hypothetical protein
MDKVKSRKPHQKSRNGCLPCRKRHVKVRSSHVTLMGELTMAVRRTEAKLRKLCETRHAVRVQALEEQRAFDWVSRSTHTVV